MKKMVEAWLKNPPSELAALQKWANDAIDLVPLGCMDSAVLNISADISRDGSPEVQSSLYYWRDYTDEEIQQAEKDRAEKLERQIKAAKAVAQWVQGGFDLREVATPRQLQDLSELAHHCANAAREEQAKGCDAFRHGSTIPSFGHDPKQTPSPQ